MLLRRLLLLAALPAALVLAAPAHGAEGVIAAFDRYVIGQGFDIGLVDAATGQPLSLPPGVNTPEDEVHPTLSHDGRYLVFMRTRLVPQLDGDVVPPPERGLFVLDRQTGGVAPLPGAGSLGAGASGAVFGRVASGAGSLRLSFGIPHRTSTASGGFVQVRHVSTFGTFINGGMGSVAAPAFGSAQDVAGRTALTTHAATGVVTDRNNLSNFENVSTLARYLTFASVDDVTGATTTVAQLTAARATSGTPEGTTTTFGVSEGAGHPSPRPADRHTALHQTAGGNVDIHTLSWPLERTLTPAPESINTAAAERMPAWSPDSLQLGFVRTDNGRRALGVFDLTPGVQSPLNAPVDLGPDAPTEQLRTYQSAWGGLSLAVDATTAPSPACGTGCITDIARPQRATPLTPSVRRATARLRIGILVARVIGKRKLFGRTVPRIRTVGRVPLGAVREGRNRFRWNRRVNGRRLGRGTYLLTFRTLRGTRILSTSRSVRIKVGARGRITRAARQR